MPNRAEMTTPDAVASLCADHSALLTILAGQPSAIWAQPTGCAGWSVKDVVTHLATLFWRLVDPSRLPDVRGLPTERAQDRDVASRAGWNAGRVVDDYVDAAGRAIPILQRLRDRDDLIPLGDLGTYPASMLANGYAFDHYTHIRADLLVPRGSIDAASPPSDELRMAPTVAWILAALPQQCAAAAASLRGPVELVLTGPGGGHYVLHPGGEIVTGDGARTDTVASISCTTPALVWWSTGRASWADLGVRAAGDPATLAVLQEQIHVF
jgi:Mycothiol maleylpyruvate isomerase N-terminal domain